MIRPSPDGAAPLARAPQTPPAGPGPLPGQGPVLLALLLIGFVLMAVQLWLLTVALDLYLAGAGQQIWQLALGSGLIFLGGLLVLWLLRRRPRPRAADVQGRPR